MPCRPPAPALASGVNLEIRFNGEEQPQELDQLIQILPIGSEDSNVGCFRCHFILSGFVNRLIIILMLSFRRGLDQVEGKR